MSIKVACRSIKNRIAVRAALASIAAGLVTGCATTNQPPEKSSWIPLFNGQNLDGWRIKIAGRELDDNYLNTFRVEDGLLRVVYDDYESFNGKFGHIFYDTPFSHYKLRIEYRFRGDQVPGGPGWAFRNSGAMLHGQSPQSMGLDQDFPVSIEAQMLGGDGTNERPSANVCTPGTNIVMNGQLITSHCINANAPTFHGDQWVTMEIEVRGGDLIGHIIDGQTVLEYTQPQYDENDPEALRFIAGPDKVIREGYISLQAESHPIDFRKVELLPLSD